MDQFFGYSTGGLFPDKTAFLKFRKRQKDIIIVKDDGKIIRDSGWKLSECLENVAKRLWKSITKEQAESLIVKA